MRDKLITIPGSAITVADWNDQRLMKPEAWNDPEILLVAYFHSGTCSIQSFKAYRLYIAALEEPWRYRRLRVRGMQLPVIHCRDDPFPEGSAMIVGDGDLIIEVRIKESGWAFIAPGEDKPFAHGGIEDGLDLTREDEGRLESADEDLSPSLSVSGDNDGDAGHGNLRRTPHMDLLPRDQCDPGDEIDVTIHAEGLPPQDDEESDAIVLSAKSGRVVLAVWLTHSDELEPLDGTEGSLIIFRREAMSEKITFRFKVRENAVPGTAALLTASFFHGGLPCGRVARKLAIGPQPDPRQQQEQQQALDQNHYRWVQEPKLRRQQQQQQNDDLRLLDSHASLSITPAISAPADITVVIVSVSGDADKYEVRVTSPHLPDYKDGKTGSWRLPTSSGQMVRNLYTAISAAERGEPRKDALVGAGMELFRGSPAVFKEALEALLASGRKPETISIISEEPHIPWELMVPVGAPFDDDDADWLPLGATCRLGRWLDKGQVSPPVSMDLAGACVIRPDYKDRLDNYRPLPSAILEGEGIRGLLGGRLFEPATYMNIRTGIGGALASVLHFAGHGAILGLGQEMLILNMDSLSVLQANAMQGLRSGVRKVKPFVFLNACETGAAVLSFAGASGFPRTFASFGASAVIAPLWSVNDRVAGEVAAALYDMILAEADKDDPRPVADMLREIRRKAYEGPDEGFDSYAAYSFYGDPDFVIRRGRPAPGPEVPG